MNTLELHPRRRSLLGGAALTLAAAPMGTLLSLNAHAATASGATGFESLKTVNAGDLRVSYAESGPANGPVAILLHGWPYDIHAFVDVAPRLVAAGYRVIVPYLRGYGGTRLTPHGGLLE